VIIFTPNTVISSADANLNFAELKAKTDYLSTPDTNWVAVTFTNSWVNYGSGYDTCGYYKDALGFVHLKGLVKSGSLGTSVFTLPAGYRPATDKIFVTIGSNDGSNHALGRVTVNDSGTVVVTLAGTSFTSLEGITFKAEA
jgi:hypothetical protein